MLTSSLGRLGRSYSLISDKLSRLEAPNSRLHKWAAFKPTRYLGTYRYVRTFVPTWKPWNLIFKASD